ncbi:MAG: hypothetical protein ACI92S_005418 [Planctomycetaceae bacterium]|jgi:hypothetical protein
MPEHEFQIYLSVLSRLMKLDEQQKAAIADELSDDLEQRFEELVRSGMDRDEAIRQALDEFGDASGLAVDLTRVSQKRIRRIIMRSSLATAALLLIGFGWMFLFPPANDALNSEPHLIAQDAAAETADAVATARIANDKGKIALDADSSDFDAPFLKNQTTVNFADTALNDVLEYLSRTQEFPILLDTVAVEEAGLLVDEPINIVTGPIRVDQALDLMLSEFELTWYVEKGILHVTTIEVSNEKFLNRSYDLAPFRAAGIAPGTLLEIVMQATDAYWEEIDGSGGRVSIVGDVMTIRQTYQEHRRIPRLLGTIANPNLPDQGIYHAEKLACLQAMQKPVTANFKDTPLTDVVEYLVRAIDLPIFLDVVAIEEAGLTTDEPINLVISDQPLETVLQLMLSDFELTTIIRSGELVVTTIEVANERLHAVVYDVRKIQDPSQLLEAVPALTPGLWAERDGSGGEMSLTENGLLVVRQTEETHREIASVLKTFVAKGTNQTPHRVRRTLETRLYRLPSETADDLLSALPSTIAPETWQGDGPSNPDEDSLAVGTIQKVSVGQKVIELARPKSATPSAKKTATADPKKAEEKPAPTPPPETIVVSESVLIINQTAAVHNRIDDFLRSLGLDQSALGRKTAKLSGGMTSGGMSGGGFF